MALRNDSITLTMAEISDLTKPLSLTQGGTGATTAPAARTALGVPAGIDSQMCTAWVLLNGSLGTIRAGFNVSSITRNRAGDYTINFSQPMRSNLYCFQITTQAPRADATTRSAVLYAEGDNGNTGLEPERIRILVGDSASVELKDQGVISVAIFGGK